jgi:ribose transport system substrate-binding protein
MRITLIKASVLLMFVMSSSAFPKETLALVISSFDNPFFVTMKEGAEQQAKKMGYRLIVLDSQNDPAKELAIVEDLLTRQIEAILLNPTDSIASSASVRAANRLSIPLITLDRKVKNGEVVSHIASDNILGGELAAKYISDRLGLGAEVVQLEGLPGASASVERGQGFISMASQLGLKVVSSQVANFDRSAGLNVMENMLVAHPSLQAVFAQNDEMALGAARAINSSGRKILIIGFDGTEEGLEAVNRKEIAATIAQQPSLIGEKAVKTVHSYFNAENVKEVVPVPLKLITVSFNR